MHLMRNMSNMISWRNRLYFPAQESGFVLVVTMFVLIVLTIIGLSATSTTEIELQIAGNDRMHKETFYQSDGGVESGVQLTEENLGCPTGFKVPGGFDNADAENEGVNSRLVLQGVDIFDASFATDESIDMIAGAPANLNEYPEDDARSLRILVDPANRSEADPDSFPHTNLAIWGETRLSAGSAIQMAAGYEGRGKSAGSSGAYIAYEIHSQHKGMLNSESIVRLEWHHLIGQEGDCNY